MSGVLGHLADLLLRAPRLWLAVACALVLFGLYSITQIRFEDGMRQVFQSEHPAFAEFQNFAEGVPQPDEDILVLAESNAAFTGQQLEQLRNFAIGGQLVEGIAFGASPFAAQRYDAESDDLRSIVSASVDLKSDPAAVMEKLRENSFAGIPYIGPENRKMVFLFTLSEGLTNLEDVTPVIEELQSVADELEAQSGVAVTLTGLPPMRQTIVSKLAREQVLLNLVGGVIGSIIALILFRSLWVGALNGVAPTIALLLTLGSYGAIGISMNVITNSVTVLILVLAMADAIHMTHELRRKLGEGLEIKPAIKAMLVEIGPPSILTSLTTMIAFASLLLSQSQLIHSFAYAGIAGLVAALLALFLIHPLVFLVAWNFAFVRKAFLRSAPREWGYVGAVARIGQFFTHRATGIVFASIAALLVLGSQIVPIDTDHRFREYLEPDEPVLAALDTIQDISAPSLSLQVELRPRVEGADLLAPEALSELAMVHAATKDIVGGRPVISLQDLRELAETEGKEDETQLLRDLLEYAPERLTGTLVPGGDRLLVSALAEDDHSRTIRDTTAKLRESYAQLDLEYFTVSEPQGLLPMAASMSHSMIRELAISFMVAAILCCLLIGLWFRSWRYGIASIIPNLLPILIVGAYLMMSGTLIQFTSAIALIIAFGVAADDTIHLLHRHHLLRREHPEASSREMIIPALTHVTPALVTTSLVLAGGISATLLSSLPTAVFFGILAMTVFFLALAADLFLLPPALTTVEKR